MRSSMIALCGIAMLLSAMVAIAHAEDAKDEAIKKDRSQIAGKWRIAALEVNGNKSSAEDARKLAVVNGMDGTWSLHSDGKEVLKGTSIFDPTLKPKTIDFRTTDASGKESLYLGIYELGDRARKLCFAPEGKARPMEFSSTAGSEHILVTFERETEKP